MLKIENTLELLKKNNNSIDSTIQLFTDKDISFFKKMYNKEKYSKNENFLWIKELWETEEKNYAWVKDHGFIYNKIITKFEFELQEILSDYGKIIDPKSRLLSSFLVNFYKNLQETMDKTLIFDFNLFKNELKTIKDEDISSSWENQFQTSDFFINFYMDKYPVLTHIIVQSIEESIELIKNILSKVDADYILLRNHFNISSAITDISLNLGDSHIYGERVLSLEFKEKKIVYKPRGAKINEVLETMIDVIKRSNNKITISTPKILDREDYHWSEFIGSTTNFSEKEKIKYHYNIGALIALMYATNSHDMHCSNILVRNDSIYLIDLECMFTNIKSDINNSQDEQIKNSILSTHIVPSLQGNIDSKYLSGINAAKKLINANFSKNLDKMTESKLTSLFLNNKTLLSPKHFELTIQGFNDVYNIIMENKIEFIELVIPFTHQISSRFLVRGTNEYTKFINSRYHPRFLTNFIDYRLYFTLIYNNKIPKNIQKIEYNEVSFGRVPLFEVTLNSNELICGKKIIKNFLSKSPFVQFKEKINLLNDKDRQLQEYLLQKSLNVLNFDYYGKPKIKSQILTRKMGKIEDIMNNIEPVNKKYPVNISKFNNTDLLTFMDGSIYQGFSGIIFQFLCMYIYTKKKKWLYKASELYLKTYKLFNNVENIGVFTGLGSQLYISYLLYKHTGDKICFEHFKYCLNNINKNITICKEYDVISGSGGLLILCMNIYNDCSLHLIKETLEKLVTHISCGLISKKESSITWSDGLVGFSHGNSGILYGLALFNSKFPRKTLQEIIQKGLSHEKEFRYVDGWYDLRYNKIEPDFYAWCHGLPGILLARKNMLVLSNLSKEVVDIIHDDINFGNNIRTRAFDKDDYSLCHGVSGNVQCLDGNQAIYHRMLENLNQISYDVRNPLCNVDYSLMTGITGEIYSILAYEDKSIPNILLLEV